MNKKNAIRTVVLVGLLAWPGVEWYRYQVAKNQLAASIELRRTMTERLASLQQLQVPAPPAEANPTIPVNNDASTAAPPTKGI